jgi:hypothetical protein
MNDGLGSIDPLHMIFEIKIIKIIRVNKTIKGNHSFSSPFKMRLAVFSLQAIGIS